MGRYVVGAILAVLLLAGFLFTPNEQLGGSAADGGAGPVQQNFQAQIRLTL